MPYLVRNTYGTQLGKGYYVPAPNRLTQYITVAAAHRFGTLEEAEKEVCAQNIREVVQVTWIVRWIWPAGAAYNDLATYYRGDRECGMLWGETLAAARRYDSPAAARAAMKKRWPKHANTKVYRVLKVVR